MQAGTRQGALIGHIRDRSWFAVYDTERGVIADDQRMPFIIVHEAVIQARVFQQATDEGKVGFVVLHTVRQGRQLAGIEIVAVARQLLVAGKHFFDDLQDILVLEDAAIAGVIEEGEPRRHLGAVAVELRLLPGAGELAYIAVHATATKLIAKQQT